MRQIRVWADTHSTGLIDELGASVRRAETSVSDQTWSELQLWVEDYDYIIPLGQDERGARGTEIEALDRRGLALMKRVREEWPRTADGEPVSLQYFSEGRLGYLEVPTAEPSAAADTGQ